MQTRRGIVKMIMGISGALAPSGCTPHVAIEGGDKPIKIDMTVTLKVDQQLDSFYSFQNKIPATTPAATQPAEVAP